MLCRAIGAARTSIQSDCMHELCMSLMQPPTSVAVTAARERTVPAPPHANGRFQCVAFRWGDGTKSPSCRRCVWSCCWSTVSSRGTPTQLSSSSSTSQRVSPLK